MRHKESISVVTVPDALFVAILFCKLRLFYMRILISLILLISASAIAHAADPADIRALAESTPSVQRNPYRGFSWKIDDNGDSMLVVHLRELTVYPPMKFKNKKQEEFFWRTVRDVKLTPALRQAHSRNIGRDIRIPRNLRNPKGARGLPQTNGKRTFRAIQAGIETLFKTSGENTD